MKKHRYRGRIRLDSGQHRRIMCVALVLGVLGLLLPALRLVQLMVVDFDDYAAKALRNQTRATGVSAERGVIFDRNMNILAGNESVENVYLDPHELRQSGADIPAIATVLSALLGLESDWIEQQAGDLRLRYKLIKAGVDVETAGKIREYINEKHILGIHLEPGVKRVYPFGRLAAQVIGFTNASNTGSEGIEAAYNSYLEGAAGKVITTKGNNEMDMPFSYEQYVATIPGCSVVLTLDTVVQACLEKEMQAAIDRYQVLNGAFGMVMDVDSGEILAMATLGSYDPNQYLEIADPDAAAELERLRMAYMAEPEDSDAYSAGKARYREALTQARLKQWRNRCISDGYEPGSTFKVLTMASALDCGAIDLNTGFSCGGAERIPGRAQLLHCWRSAGHGAQQTPQALQNSCNLAFAHIALKLGGARFYEYVQRFGILEKTGIDLSGESKGVFFDKALVTDTGKWGTASLTSGSFGQTFKLTPLQLVRAIASVVNGGLLMEPYIVSEIVDAEGNTVLRQEPVVVRRTIKEETSAVMCRLLESVVTEGTAKNAAVAGFSVGGKTGTSEKIDVFDENGQRVLDKIVSFVGIAPMDDPRYIVLVALDTPSRATGLYISGGMMAAPTVGAVLSGILPYLGVESAAETAEQCTVPDVTGLNAKEAQKALTQVGLSAMNLGSEERATAQIPKPGTQVPQGSQIVVYYGTEPSDEPVKVPDFTGMNRQQASQTALPAGLLLLIAGNPEVAPDVRVTRQSIPPGTEVAPGTTVTLEFYRMTPPD